LPRSQGTAVFLDRDPETTPLALSALVKHMRVLQENVILLTIDTASVPYLPFAENLKFDNLGNDEDGIVQVTCTIGYMDQPDVPKVMRAIAATRKLDFDVAPYRATYFLSQMELRPGDGPGMPRWRKTLFIATSHLASDPADHFGLPSDRAVLLGSKLAI
jgi:KUP system potassium uptake protein